MAMNLIIDYGNSYVKWAIFKGKKLTFKQTTTHSDFESFINKLLIDFPQIHKAILSSVGNVSKEQIKFLQRKVNTVHILNYKSILPYRSYYKTPKTLGVDRIALIAAACGKYAKSNVLVIDAGTCITFDFLTASNNYLGGAISPGIRLRYKALHNLTAKLPLLETKKPSKIIGNSTDESIHSGVINGTIFEIDGVIDKYKEKYPDLTVILTGGDAKFLSKNLKSTIFANSNFLLEGLNYILQLNSD